MAFYDHFINSKTGKVSKIGKKIIDWQNGLFLDLIEKFSEKKLCDTNLLEIGPGKGFFLKKCKDRKIRYTAIEGNKLMSKSLKNKGFNVHCDFVPPIKLNEKFDVIFMDQVFEHMKNRDQAIEMIKTCREHLNKNGLLIISSPDIFAWKEDFYAGDYTHDYPVSLYRLSQIFLDNNLGVLYANYYSFFIKGYIATRFITFLTRLFYNIGVLKLVFNKKAYKVKTSLLPSCIIIGKKNE